MSLQRLPHWNLLHRLKERWNVDADFVNEIDRRLSEGRHAIAMADNLRSRIAYLESHVPPEIANPPKAVAWNPRPRPESSG